MAAIYDASSFRVKARKRLATGALGRNAVISADLGIHSELSRVSWDITFSRRQEQILLPGAAPLRFSRVRVFHKSIRCSHRQFPIHPLFARGGLLVEGKPAPFTKPVKSAAPPSRSFQLQQREETDENRFVLRREQPGAFGGIRFSVCGFGFGAGYI
jgi:hypothetical protein